MLNLWYSQLLLILVKDNEKKNLEIWCVTLVEVQAIITTHILYFILWDYHRKKWKYVHYPSIWQYRSIRHAFISVSEPSHKNLYFLKLYSNYNATGEPYMHIWTYSSPASAHQCLWWSTDDLDTTVLISYKMEIHKLYNV